MVSNWTGFSYGEESEMIYNKDGAAFKALLDARIGLDEPQVRLAE